MKFITLCLLSLCLNTAVIRAQAPQNQQLSDIVQQAWGNSNRAERTDLLRSGMKIVEAPNRATFKDEMSLLDLFADINRKNSDFMPKLHNLIDLLSRRYGDDPRQKAVLLFHIATIYRDTGNPKSEQEALGQMNSLLDLADGDVILLRFKSLKALGESYVNTERSKAIPYFRQIMNMPGEDLINRNYGDTSDVKRDIYTDAAVRLVELTPPKDYRTLVFWPFVYPVIARDHAEALKQVLVGIPGMAEFKSRMLSYLENHGNHQKDPALKEHFRAVMEFIRNSPDY